MVAFIAAGVHGIVLQAIRGAIQSKRISSSRRLSGMIAPHPAKAMADEPVRQTICPWYHGARSKRRVDT
jgi:hypothetical protein